MVHINRIGLLLCLVKGNEALHRSERRVGRQASRERERENNCESQHIGTGETGLTIILMMMGGGDEIQGE
jgi:hypothetical protein